MTEEDLRREILNAIIECKDNEGETVVSRVNDAKLLRDALFDALLNKAFLNID